MSTKYSRVPKSVEEAAVDESENEEKPLTRLLGGTRASCRLALWAIAVLVVVSLLSGLVGSSVGALIYRKSSLAGHLPGTVPQVPIGLSVQTFQHNESFAAPPTAAGDREPIWDSLIPSGLGYVKDDPLSGRNISVISAFHQLHCLYTLRRALYSTTSGGEDFDFGLDREHHVGHCFEYLRQSIMCSADSSIEPAEEAGKAFLGWGFKRQCRDYDELGEWAEKWRAFDGYGFLAHPTHRHDDHE